ncbi:hypothetical protein Barb6XT_02984 [Bacteroidales bacterium Barb6XT]|nr:hypothetical protein Barb6XT_02984 [Bacteroidales bacterium Barb6XT]
MERLMYLYCSFRTPHGAERNVRAEILYPFRYYDCFQIKFVKSISDTD